MNNRDIKLLKHLGFSPEAIFDFVNGSRGTAQPFVPLTGTTWNGDNSVITLTTNTVLTLTSDKTAGLLYIRGNNNFTLTINGILLTINNIGDSIVGYFKVDNGYVFTVELNAFSTLPVEEYLVWSQLSNMTDAGNGTLDNSTAGTGGGTATKRLIKADGNYIQYNISSTLINESEAFVFGIDNINDANYQWAGGAGTVTPLAAAYILPSTSEITTQTGDPNIPSSATGTGVIGTAGSIIRLEISGDNVIFKYSTNGGASFITLATQIGVLTGITNLYIKGVLAVGSASQRILQNCKGFGIVTI